MGQLEQRQNMPVLPLIALFVSFRQGQNNFIDMMIPHEPTQLLHKVPFAAMDFHLQPLIAPTPRNQPFDGFLYPVALIRCIHFHSFETLRIHISGVVDKQEEKFSLASLAEFNSECNGCQGQRGELLDGDDKTAHDFP